jgi:acetyl esterase
MLIPDPSLAALLADRRMAVRPCPPDASLTRYRAALDGFLAGLRGPEVDSVQDLTVAGRPARLYRPAVAGPIPVILAIHGGGFVFGGLETHDAIWRHLCRSSGAAVLACTYRLAPENQAPAAEDDCHAAFVWLLENAYKEGLSADHIAVFGDSAGGYLALRLAGRTGGASAIRHLALAYPCLDPHCDSHSQKAFADGYMMTGAALRWFWDCYLGPGKSAPPLPANLPPTSILTAEFDPLRDEAEVLHRRLIEGGVAATLHREDGMIHGFLGLPHTAKHAGRAFVRLGKTLSKALFAVPDVD